MQYYSPLRYPGGKAYLANLIKELIKINDLMGCTYHEVYAGGAGLALELLLEGICSKIVLNDKDFHLYSFWYSILNHADDFINKINIKKINLENWEKQKTIYKNYQSYSIFEVGFSTFYLNRCNRSGILHKAGPIGGQKQEGKYLIDARFNKKNLIKRIEKINEKKDSIEIHQKEGIQFIKELFSSDHLDSIFTYLDPPYYEQGSNLYLNFYEHSDHENLANLLKKNKELNWLLSYDNKEEIQEFYTDLRVSNYSANYSLQSKKKATELLVFSNTLRIPSEFTIYGRESKLKVLQS